MLKNINNYNNNRNPLKKNLFINNNKIKISLLITLKNKKKKQEKFYFITKINYSRFFYYNSQRTFGFN